MYSIAFIVIIYSWSQGIIEYCDLFSKDLLTRDKSNLNKRGKAKKFDKEFSLGGFLKSFKAKFTEVFDLYKDLGYILYLKHKFLILICLCNTVTVPFAIFHQNNFKINTFSIT